jgi:membrane protease YdiL (CAAX protease family)
MTKNLTYTLQWPLILVFTRFVLALGLQMVLAIFFFRAGYQNPIEDAGHWFTVYGTLIDILCLILIAFLIKKEGLRLIDLVNINSQSFIKTLLTSLGYIVLFLPMSVVGMSVSSFLLFGDPIPQQTMGGIPMWGAIYSITIWPLLWAVSEQITYQGYALPRIATLLKSKWLAIAIVSFGWALQHAALPLSLDWRYIVVRVLSFIPVAMVMAFLYLRTRKLLPFIIAHWVMDLTAAITSILLPLII